MAYLRVDAVDIDEEVDRSAQDGARPVRGWIGDEARVPEAASELDERDLGFEASERSAEAVVDAAAVAQVLVVASVGDEPLRVAELERVTVSRREQEMDVRTLGDGPAGDLDVGDRASIREVLHRWLEAKELLDE
jgi:hypothetical protein